MVTIVIIYFGIRLCIILWLDSVAVLVHTWQNMLLVMSLALNATFQSLYQDRRLKEAKTGSEWTVVYYHDAL